MYAWLRGNNLQASCCGTSCYLALGCVVLLGCSTHNEGQSQEESNLKPLAIFYGQYTGEHQGQGPASEAEFKKYVESLNSEALSSFGITDPSSIFISSRDKKPYVIIYGAGGGIPDGTGGDAGLAGGPVIAYEQEGVGGKRFIATSLGMIEEVDEARFKQLVPNSP